MIINPTTLDGLCRARRLLSDDGTSLPVNEVARKVAISPRHFARQFEVVFGITPHQYRTRARLDRARRLLVSGELSVTVVCMELGFSSLGSFSALFRSRVGVPPSAYQRRGRALVQVPGALPQALFPGCMSLMSRLPPGAFGRNREAPAARP